MYILWMFFNIYAYKPRNIMTICLQDIETKIDNQERIETEEARWLWLNADSQELQRLASKVRARFHKPNSATYLLMRIVNYTNVCVAKCDYCSFYRLPNSDEGYVKSKEWIFFSFCKLLFEILS